MKQVPPMSMTTGKPLERLRARAEKGNVDAQCRLADLYLEQETDEGNRAALPWLRKAARQGVPWAQYQLGYAYQEGLGVPRNKQQAVHHYELSAAQGYDSAQLNLGILLANGTGKHRDLKEAIRLYRLAARQGNRNACFNLGLYYEMGRGVPQNDQQSFRWYLKAAGLGDAEAQRSAGRERVGARSAPLQVCSPAPR